MSNLKFEEIYRDRETKARLGNLTLPHGSLKTPAFMPVGTNATVKGIYHEKLTDIGYNLILANTYHVYLRPGIEVIKKFGSLHEFCSWNGNILTDSGGFQVFSLSGLRKIKDSGVTFQSHIDGSRHLFTPEKVVDIQSVFGSDIAMCLDVCTPPNIEYKNAIEAWRVTKSWAERSLFHKKELGEEFRGNLFGIVQGNFYKDLRKESALCIGDMDFDGIAIGGLSVGEEKNQFIDFLSYTAEFLPSDKPHYVMGIGSPDYILEAVENGIDIFDCVLATRMARNGGLFTDDGVIPIKKAIYKFDEGPVVPSCSCSLCTRYSKAYMHHLHKCNEIFASMLATEHNLTYLYDLMTRIRSAIRNNNFKTFKKEYLARFYKDKQ